MKVRSSLFLSCIVMSAFLFGCDNDDAYKHDGVRCNASYVVDSSGQLCYFGECAQYDGDLRDHYCPADVPLCVEDDAGLLYCTTHCPAGYVQTGSECKKGDNECPENLIRCEDECIDPMSNMSYCGSDEKCIPNECQPGQLCVDGECQCSGDSVQCDDQCADIQNDAEHCGGCGNNCKEQEGWSDGICQSGKCVATSCTDGYFIAGQADGTILCEKGEPCGNSGVVCPPHSTCIPEIEKCACDTGYVNCLNGCFDLNTSLDHCGVCDNACHVAHAQNECHDGACSFTCEAGYVVSADGSHCEQQQTDACIEGEKRCNGNSFEICQNGTWVELEVCSSSVNSVSVCDPKLGCVTNCMAGNSLCPPNMCVNVLTDTEHCGGCDQKCDVAHATNTCKSGECWFTCDPGYFMSKDGKGCEPESCTENGIKCSGLNVLKCVDNHWVTVEVCTSSIANSHALCEGAKCSWQCNDGYSMCSKGCINTLTDVNNCGGCGKICEAVANATKQCESGTCSFSCNSGFVKTKDGKGCEKYICANGATRCNSVDYQKCTDNKWLTIQTCSTNVSNAKPLCHNNWGCDWACTSGLTKCTNACIDTTSDNDNCGGCNKKCTSVTNGKNTCNNGQCTITCNSNYLVCGNSCVGLKQKGIVNKNTTLYTNPGSGTTSNVSKNSIYSIYGQSGNYYAIGVSNQKRYIAKNDIYILPAKGTVTASGGVVIRKCPSKDCQVISFDAIKGTNLTILDYQDGFYQVNCPKDYCTTGYGSAEYIELISGSSAGSLPNCP